MGHYDLSEEEEEALDRDRVDDAPPPHRTRLTCCTTCDLTIARWWALALESAYDHDGEPRTETRWDQEAEDRHERGLP